LSTAIIINPVSGGVSPSAGRARAELARAVVDRHGDPVEVFITERAGHARELAKAAVRRRARLVLAWGGDGTINEVASALAFDEVPMGIVPGGSGNGLALELGISLNAERAIADALAAEPRPMDLGEVNDRIFANIAGIGFDAHVAAQFNAPGNRRRGFATYASITLQSLRRYAAGDYRITTEGGVLETHAVLVTIANSAQFGNGARIAPGAKVNDGLLDLVVLSERSRLRTCLHLPRLFNGTVAKTPGCVMTRIAHATIESDRPMTFHVDGEPVEGGTKLRVRVHPGALRVAVR
jgi:diacylglycerol kinase (ATP)